MALEKVKHLIPAMEKFIKASAIDGMERGFTFRTNEKAEIEEICNTGTKSQMIMKIIKQKEGTKTGNFHTHQITRKTKQTHGIAETFSCPDILSQVGHKVDYSCVGNKDEIVCSTLKSKLPEEVKYQLLECSLHVMRMLEDKQYENYKGSEMERNDIKLLDKLETNLDKQLRPFLNFDVIKKF